MRTTIYPDICPSASNGSIAARTSHGPTILVTEDTAEVRSFVRRILEGLGYRVLAAETGQEALTISDQYEDRIDLLLMDVVLPDMFGPAAASRIRERRPLTKTIFMSGFTSLPILEEMSDEGVDLIHKPFARGVFASRIREVLEAA